MAPELKAKLAAEILAFDEDFPGHPEAAVEIPFDVWAEWIGLAGKIGDEANAHAQE